MRTNRWGYSNPQSADAHLRGLSYAAYEVRTSRSLILSLSSCQTLPSCPKSFHWRIPSSGLISEWTRREDKGASLNYTPNSRNRIVEVRCDRKQSKSEFFSFRMPRSGGRFSCNESQLLPLLFRQQTSPNGSDAMMVMKRRDAINDEFTVEPTPVTFATVTTALWQPFCMNYLPCFRHSWARINLAPERTALHSMYGELNAVHNGRPHTHTFLVL